MDITAITDATPMISEVPTFPEALGNWAWTTLEMVGWLIVCGLIVAVPLGVVWGILRLLSKLLRRIRRGRVPRNGEGG